MPVTALGTLIQEQRGRLGAPGKPLSFRDLEHRSKGRLSHNRFNQYENKPLVNVPPTETLQVLADVLQLPLPVVVDAALESVGLRRTTAPPSRWVTIAHAAEEMPASKRRALERQVEALIAMYRDEGQES